MYDEHRVRRARYLDALGGAASLIVGPSSPVEEGEFRYCSSSDLYYLTGWEGAGAALFRPGADHPYILFVEPRQLHQEAVTGVRAGVDEAVEIYGADAAFALGELEPRLYPLCAGYPSLHFAFGYVPELDQRVWRALRRGDHTASRNGVILPDQILDPMAVLGELRCRKSPAELACMRTAGAISSEAHRLAMGIGRHGVREYEVEAAINASFRSRGGNGPGYATTVGAGANACTLHYTANRGQLRDGELCLVDAGCRYEHYTADLTRTWPVNGRFEGPGRALYEVVYAAWNAGVARLRVGAPWSTTHDAVLRALCEGLVALELLEGPVEEAIHEERYRRFYRHEVGHWLGLDVHDPGAYYRVGRSRLLEAGMVLALEPGLYVQPDDEEAPEIFRGIGVRIEDDFVVTEGEPEILTPCPRSIEDIEAVIRR